LVPRLCLITPDQGDLVLALGAALGALPPGAALVQLRRKSASAAGLFAEARRLLPLCRSHGARLLLNDRADVALAAGADGVHLPSSGLPPAEARALLGPRALLGVSCHSPGEVLFASRAGADFCVFGPVFATPGKSAQGLEALRASVRAAPIAVLALGGVEPGNARAALETGAVGVACIRSVLGAPDPAAQAALLWKALSQ